MKVTPDELLEMCKQALEENPFFDDLELTPTVWYDFKVAFAPMRKSQFKTGSVRLEKIKW